MDEEKKEYKHISEKKKKSFSVKKISRLLFFILLVVFFAVVSHKAARFVMNKRYEKMFRDIFAKVEEDSKVSNFYEKKNWEGDTRETWRKDNNYLIVDTSEDGKATKSYYIDGVSYVLTESVDEINNKSTKNAIILTGLTNDLPTFGLQVERGKKNTEEDIKNRAKMSSVKSVKIEDIDCYQIYMKYLNDIYYVRKSDNRVIREIYYRKNEKTGEIERFDSGVIEIKTDCVTDEDIALPDLSDYVVERKDVQKILEEKYGNSSESE